jgi:hypothetical protein
MANQGDERTPDKTIGQIKYADDKTPMAEQEKTGLKGGDKRQGDLQDAPGDDHMPEGLKREPKGPLDKDHGCKHETGKV